MTEVLEYARLNIADLLINQGYIERTIKLEELRADIGDDLFYSLSDAEKQFIIDTEGVVDFGHKMTEEDFLKTEKFLREDYDYK